MNNKDSDSPPQSKMKSLVDNLLVSLAIIIGFMIGLHLGFIGYLFFVVPVTIVFYTYQLWKKIPRVSQRTANIIAWSNLLTWIIPMLGVVTGILSIKFSTFEFGNKKTIRTLGIVGLLLSLSSVLIVLLAVIGNF